jgi:hypothetical protein
LVSIVSSADAARLTPSFHSSLVGITPSDFGCVLDKTQQWIKRVLNPFDRLCFAWGFLPWRKWGEAACLEAQGAGASSGQFHIVGDEN